MAKKEIPSMDQWLREAKMDPSSASCGMYLVHNGTVRQSARAKVRDGDENTLPVSGMVFHANDALVQAAIERVRQMDGIYYIRVWLNDGELQLGDNIMYVLVGGDIRSHVIDALQTLVGIIKTECVEETETY